MSRILSAAVLSGLSAVVIHCPELGRLERFVDDWVRNGPAVPLAIYDVALSEDPVEGCYRSHLAVLDHDGPLLVVEDDAFFCASVSTVVSVPDDADVVYLGGIFRRFEVVAPGLLRLHDGSNCTHAYVAPRPRQLRAALLGARKGKSIARALAALDLVRYGVDPAIAGQRGGWSSIRRRQVREGI
jgi:hypothetical protein